MKQLDEIRQKIAKAKEDENADEIKEFEAELKKSERKISTRKDDTENLDGKQHFATPTWVAELENISLISSGSHFNYAAGNGKVFSWGFGMNYVLGNKEDDNEFRPYQVDQQNMYWEHALDKIACASQHVVVLASPSTQVTPVEESKEVSDKPMVADQTKPDEPKPEEPKPEVADEPKEAQSDKSMEIDWKWKVENMAQSEPKALSKGIEDMKI